MEYEYREDLDQSKLSGRPDQNLFCLHKKSMESLASRFRVNKEDSH